MELLTHVRRAADEFVRALKSAEQQTNQWADQARTNALVHDALQQCLSQLAQSNCWGEANQTAANQLWQIAGRWLETGWLQRRAREKPRGYAGDFELLAKIDSHFVSDDPLGRSFDTFFQGQPAAQAVRNRHAWLQQELVDIVRRRNGRPVRCASVGCGPACDIKAALSDLTFAQRQTTHITLLDLDPASLDYATSELVDLLPPHGLDTIRENLFRLSRVASKSAALKGADFLSCPGLFDYLKDADAIALLETFWEQLVPGGRMMVFNFAPNHPSQAYMEWVGSWYLTYRSQTELQLLAERSGIPRDCVTIASKSTTTDSAVIADKPT
jgi:hypothetical protein